MTALATTLRVETIKLRRTLALWMVVIAPLVVVGLQFAMVANQAEYFSGGDGIDPWLGHIQNIKTIWAILMLPLFITLEAALLAQLEHSEKHWKQLYAQPVPRWAHYAAKFAAGLLLTLLATVVLVVGAVLSGVVLRALFPILPLTWATIPWGSILLYMGRVYLASWLIIAIHTWVANRWSSFNLAIGVGILTTVPNIMIMQSEKWAPRYPWTMPFVASTGFLHPEMYAGIAIVLIGLLGGLAAALLTGWEFSRRDVL